MNGSSRSIAIKKNIIASLFLKGISILVSLQVVPLTINYINPTRYGIWLTLSSIVAWLSYFDLGFAHGFRNRFAEAVAKRICQYYLCSFVSAFFQRIFDSNSRQSFCRLECNLEC